MTRRLPRRGFQRFEGQLPSGCLQVGGRSPTDRVQSIMLN